eukprot:6186911-Pleurochrysis_carterae.AAC.1
MKGELSELRSEWGVLARTESILKEQEASVSVKLNEARAQPLGGALPRARWTVACGTPLRA